MRVHLNGDLLRSLIKVAGGINAVQTKWRELRPTVKEPSDSTFFRWMNGEQLPKNSETLMALASVLDVDPIALLVVEKGETHTVLDDLLEIVQNREFIPSPLSFVKPFLQRQKIWPPPIFAKQHYKRPWEEQPFNHDPAIRSNFYQVISLRGENSSRAQVFHFAYHQPGLYGARWLQYGAVVRYERTAFLWHINGHTEERELRGIDEPALVDTWFGPTETRFKIASLHPFKLSKLASWRGDKPPMRFPA